MEEFTDDTFDQMVADGLLEVVEVRNGEKLYRLTKTGSDRARRILIDHGADPDNSEQVEGVIRSWA